MTDGLRTFVRPNVVPPGGRYFYEVPETKVYFEAPSLPGLETHLRRYYQANGIPVPANLMVLVEDFICRRMPKGFCSGGDPEVRVVTLAMVRERTVEVLSRPLVDPGTAALRGKICGQCKHNDRTLCPSCVGLVAWSLQVVGQLQQGYHNWLGVCELDCTAVPAKIYSKSVQVPEGYSRPEGCWMTEVVS
jgi:hypothetical protein